MVSLIILQVPCQKVLKCVPICLYFVEFQHLINNKVAAVIGLHQVKQSFQPGSIEKDNCIIFGRVADIEEAVKGNCVDFPIFRLFIFPMHLDDNAVWLPVVVFLSPVPVVGADVLWSLEFPDSIGDELTHLGAAFHIVLASPGDNDFTPVLKLVDAFVSLAHIRKSLLVNANHIVGVIVERITALVVPHLSIKHTENGVDVVLVDFFLKDLTEPIKVAVRKVADNIGVDAIAVLIVADEKRIPHDVFGKAVGLDFTEVAEGDDVFFHDATYFGVTL